MKTCWLVNKRKRMHKKLVKALEKQALFDYSDFYEFIQNTNLLRVAKGFQNIILRTKTQSKTVPEPFEFPI